MSDVTTVGIDLAKNVFSLHGVDAEGAVVLRRSVNRGIRSAVLPGFSRRPRRSDAASDRNRNFTSI
jgi:hypothetical protein